MTKDLSKSTIIAPMATAIWLIDNTSLSFKQIGDFCDFTEAEVKLIADGVIGNGIFPLDPTKNGNLTSEEIYNREQDGGELHNAFKALEGININIQKKKKYIPMLQRRSRPETILWLINYCPELTDAQIIKLVRTTKSMVQSIRDKTYNEYNDLVAKDPVVLGFCSQKSLDQEIEIAKAKTAKLTDKENKEIVKKAKNFVKKINVNKIKVVKPKKEGAIKPKVKSNKQIKKVVVKKDTVKEIKQDNSKEKIKNVKKESVTKKSNKSSNIADKKTETKKKDNKTKKNVAKPNKTSKKVNK